MGKGAFCSRYCVLPWKVGLISLLDSRPISHCSSPSPISLTSSIDSLPKLKAYLPTLREKLVSEPEYFKKVYNHAFQLARGGPQSLTRSLPLDTGKHPFLDILLGTLLLISSYASY